MLSEDANGSYLAINLGWGLAVMLGVYAAAGVSGAHLNPAVSVGHGRAAWLPVGRRCRSYIAAQIAGAFVASAVVFLTYREAFAAFDGGVRQVQGPARHRGHLRHLSAAVPVASSEGWSIRLSAPRC